VKHVENRLIENELFFVSSEYLRNHRAAPNGSKAKNETADGVEGGQQESAASNRGQCLPSYVEKVL